MEEEKKCCEEEECYPWWTRLLGRRTIMAYIFTVATVIGFGYGMINPDKFSEMVMMILAFYFMTRKEEQV